jgi:hypothetical protein
MEYIIYLINFYYLPPIFITMNPYCSVNKGYMVQLTSNFRSIYGLEQKYSFDFIVGYWLKISLVYPLLLLETVEAHMPKEIMYFPLL